MYQTNEEVDKRLVKKFEFHSMVMLKSVIGMVIALVLLVAAYNGVPELYIPSFFLIMVCFMGLILSIIRVNVITQILGAKSTEEIRHKLKIMRKFL